MKDQVIGIYENEKLAAEAVEELKTRGYRSEEISVIAKNKDGDSEITKEVEPSAMDGAVAGAATGGALGMAGMIVGLPAVLVPGLGAVLAAGPIITMLGGAVVGANSGSGGLLPALKDIGLSDEDAERYTKDVEDGKILVFLQPK
ncbi:general stress protein [Bacillus sp. FJAT-27251]|uniref:general stress protein n=1 Tax=Bacillus sp. FJAT-27251 TaxID=1684142 RepID=UPI0006A79551|nr:general stress protein [Bacillus sp. FJAT-27251]